MMANDASCTREVKSRIAIAKSALDRKKRLFLQQTGLNLRKKLVNCYIWSIACYGVETGTLRIVGQNYFESFEIWCWKKMEKTIWTDRVKS
jgi:hypothetical protein